MIGRPPWRSPTFGVLSEPEAIKRLIDFLGEAPEEPHHLYIGTDSKPNHEHPVYLVSAIVLHRPGYGGIYVWQRQLAGPFPSLRARIRAEARRSAGIARRLKRSVLLHNPACRSVSVHLDIGRDGDTRALIQEVVAVITAEGFPAAIKPESFAASRVAHLHTTLPALIPHPA